MRKAGVWMKFTVATTSPTRLHNHELTTETSMSGTDDGPNGAADTKDPSGFLSEIIGAPVTVKLNSGVVYKGFLPSTFSRAVST